MISKPDLENVGSSNSKQDVSSLLPRVLVHMLCMQKFPPLPSSAEGSQVGKYKEMSLLEMLESCCQAKKTVLN